MPFSYSFLEGIAPVSDPSELPSSEEERKCCVLSALREGYTEALTQYQGGVYRKMVCKLRPKGKGAVSQVRRRTEGHSR